MIQTHEKFNIVDLNLAPTNVFFEVNWNPDDERTNNCQVFKMTLPDGAEHFISRKILLEMLFACGRPEDQRNMVPQTLETVHHYKSTLGITATKDIHKGEEIKFPVEFSVPCNALRQDVIGQLPKEYKNGIKGTLPLIH